MIAIILDQVPFEQDIRELFMAFYPGERYTHEPDPNAMISFTASHPSPEDKTYLLCLSVKGKGERHFSSPAHPDRLEAKNELKRALYRVLSEENQRRLPWGTLTGIRPAKLALQMLFDGKSEGEVQEILRDRYGLSETRNALCVRTAANERRALSGLHLKQGWSLYIGIPFCPTTCLYCSFPSYPIGKWKRRIDWYLSALLEELSCVSGWMEGRPLETIYMGGGTPTSLEAEELDRILEAVSERFDLSFLRELTVEAGRPDSITEAKLSVLKKRGTTRISINPQTLKQETLDLIGRRHTVHQFFESFRLARSFDFACINTDLIVGLPNETEEDVRRTMEGIRSLAPDDVTIHSLALKRAARLNTEREAYRDVRYGDVSAMVSLAYACCEEMGLHPYYLYRQKNMAGNLENVGWCRPGCEGLYNILIMEELQTIVGCGAGTTTRVLFPEEGRYERQENVKDPSLYAERLPELLEKKRRLLAGT
ncbi:coproporphyrinogen dehydrogenase HemZ [Lachnospiraceae bacterium]|nr:coproporphyrinogen dehydrogenase HemZ [Lachnospiraceae bacterium]